MSDIDQKDSAWFKDRTAATQIEALLRELAAATQQIEALQRELAKLRRAGLVISGLEKRVEVLRQLVKETMADHANADSGLYNICDDSPCNWCERAKEATK